MTTLVRVLQAPYTGVVVCHDHFGQIAGGAVLAHTELSADPTWFWGERCLMCGVDAVPDRLCENVDCKKPLHPQWPAVYCCNECALEDV